MSLTTDSLSASDVALLTGNNSNNDAFGGNGAWWLIVLFIFALCGGWGNGFGGFGGGSGASENYVLASDFATLQRQLSDGFNSMERKGDTITNGLCDGFYTQAQLVNGVNTNIMQSANAIQSQLASCCCDIREGISGVNYNMAMNANATQNAINTGFCQTNFNNQTNTRDIIESQNAGTRAILEAIQANKVEALNQKIAEQTQQINALQLSASQAMQNNYIVNALTDKLSPCPKPSYLVCNPNAPLNYSVNYGGCGCNA